MIDIHFRLPERKCQLEVFCLLVLQKLKINVTFFVPSQFDFNNLTLKTEKEPSIIMIRNQKNN